MSDEMIPEICPVCQPEADPVRELILLAPCDVHRPSLAGSDDWRVSVMDISRSGPELPGAEARRACDVIHRGAR